MKTMRDYILYCTPEQSKRAWMLGAPIETKTIIGYQCNDEYPVQLNVFLYGKIPTAEQMLGWLREKGLFLSIRDNVSGLHVGILEVLHGRSISSTRGGTYEQAMIYDIDAALDYLERGEKI